MTDRLIEIVVHIDGFMHKKLDKERYRLSELEEVKAIPLGEPQMTVQDWVQEGLTPGSHRVPGVQPGVPELANAFALGNKSGFFNYTPIQYYRIISG